MAIHDLNSPTGVYIPGPEISPIWGLPALIGKAVNEVQKSAQAPLELVIASALGAISLACQDRIRVKGLAESSSPCSLFLLTIAESGDRKSTVDRMFTKPIIEYEEEKEIEYQKFLLIHNSKMESWNVVHKKLLGDIRKSDATGNTHEELNNKLHNHNLAKPLHPKRRKLIYNNATPESIVFGMYKNSSSAGIISDEAGGILNGQAMDDLGMLNQMWDGSTLTVDRKTSESFSLKDGRLTISLMTQENSLRKFIERRDNVARGIGFLARCLVAKPDSMQGQRFISNDNKEFFESFDELDNFKLRIKRILNENIFGNFHEHEKSVILNLSTDARASLVNFYNKVENNLNSGQAYFSIKDAASKIAENAVRMAAIFHYFCKRPGDISSASMNEAVYTCEKYLLNFKDLFGEYGTYTEEKQDVIKIVNYLRDHLAANPNVIAILKTDLLKYSPVRKVNRLNKALAFLSGPVSIISQPTGVWVVIYPGHAIFNGQKI